MASLKSLASQTAVYGISTILGRTVNFLLVPFYTDPDIFSTEQYGVVTYFYAIVTFLNVVFQFGMETTYFRFANKLDERKAFNQAQSFVLTLGAILVGLMMLSSDQVSSLLGYPDYDHILIIVAAILFVDSTSAVPFARLRQRKLSGKFAGIKLTNILLNVGLNLFFLLLCPAIHAGSTMVWLQPLIDHVYVPEWNVEYVFLSNLIANAFFWVFLSKELLDFKFSLSKEVLKPMYKYAYPLMFVGLAGMINEVLDRVLLKQMLPTSFDGHSQDTMVGIYGGVYKLSIFLTLMIQAFRYAAEPFFFSQAKDKNAPETFVKVMKWFVIACTLAVVGVSVLRDLIGSVVLRSADYQEGLFVVPILLFANLFLGVYYNQSVWYKLTDKTKYGTMITIMGAVITVAVNFFAIPVLGYVGSALATILCYSSMMTISYFLGQKHFPIPYDLKSFFFYLIFGGCLVGLTYIWNPDTILVKSLCGIGLIALFLVVTFVKERGAIRSMRGA